MNILMRQRKKYGWPVIGNLPITGATGPSKFQNYDTERTYRECYHKASGSVHLDLFLGYCEKPGKSNQQGSTQAALVVHRGNGSNIIYRQLYLYL